MTADTARDDRRDASLGKRTLGAIIPDPGETPHTHSDELRVEWDALPSTEGRHPDAMFAAMAEHSRDFICVFRSDGSIIYANDLTEEYLGWKREELVNANIADFLHPDDLERALLGVGVAVQHRPRLAPAAFRIRHADGHWVRLEINGGSLAPEYPELLSITARLSHDADLYSAVLELLIAGKPMVETLAAIPEFTIWRSDDTLCTVTWVEETTGTRRAAGSPLPSLLTGVMPPPEGRSPWIEAVATGREVTCETLDELPPSIRAAADASGLLGVWVIPVEDPSGGDPVLLTLWSAHESAPVLLSEYSARIAEQLLKLIFRWRNQQRQLENAARQDGLTGLANRAAFFEALAARPTADTGDAVLYIDIDGFKPVNDRFGHGTGDRVLLEIADRLRASVRPSDLLGRLGGDEFAVLLRHCRTDEAQAIAHRIRERLAEPVAVTPDAAKLDPNERRARARVTLPPQPTTISVGASIGVAFGAAGDSLLEAADRAQLEAKRAGGNRVRWADLPD